jgi:hypothetical protein
MAAAVIAFGGALIMGSGTTSRLNSFAAAEVNPAQKQWQERLECCVEFADCCRCRCVVLGIFALVDQPNLTFVLVGLVVTGAAGLSEVQRLVGNFLQHFVSKT